MVPISLLLSLSLFPSKRAGIVEAPGDCGAGRAVRIGRPCTIDARHNPMPA